MSNIRRKKNDVKYRESRVNGYPSHVLFLTSDPVSMEQIKGIIVRIGEAVKAILLLGKLIANRERVVLHCN